LICDFANILICSAHLVFEPVQDEVIHSPDSFELANYEEFSRQELPRIFRGALEAVVDTAAQPLEEQLRSQLVSMIQECQDRVFSSYRARNSSDPVGFTTTQPASVSTPILTSSVPPDTGTLSSIPEEGPIQVLDNLYQRPPYLNQSLSTPDFQLRGEQQASETTARNDPSESGYVSDFSTVHASVSISQEIGTDLTSDLASSCSGMQSLSQSTKDRGDKNNNIRSLAVYPDASMTEAQSAFLQQEIDDALFPPDDFPDMYMYSNQRWDGTFPS
jgi:hypothetical protein